MIGLFDSAGKRLSLTWQGYEFNGPFDDADSFDGGQQEGCFVDAVTYSTPINYQSEVQNELAKQGGGIEYYNPRIASLLPESMKASFSPSHSTAYAVNVMPLPRKKSMAFVHKPHTRA